MLKPGETWYPANTTPEIPTAPTQGSLSGPLSFAHMGSSKRWKSTKKPTIPNACLTLYTFTVLNKHEPTIITIDQKESLLPTLNDSCATQHPFPISMHNPLTTLPPLNQEWYSPFFHCLHSVSWVMMGWSLFKELQSACSHALLDIFKNWSMCPLFSNTTICVYLLCREKTESARVVFCNMGLQNKNQSPLSLFNLFFERSKPLRLCPLPWNQCNAIRWNYTLKPRSTGENALSSLKVSKVFELGILAIMQKQSFENYNENIKVSQRFPPAKTKILIGFLLLKASLSEISMAKMFVGWTEFSPPRRQTIFVKGSFFYLYKLKEKKKSPGGHSFWKHQTTIR